MVTWLPDSRLDRAAAARPADGWVAAQWDRDDAVVLYVDDQSGLSSNEGAGELRAVRPADAWRPDTDFLVGLVDGAPWFATTRPDAIPSGPATSLRVLVTSLDHTLADLATTAVAMVNWHRSHGFCPGCGDATDVAEGGHMRRCRTCQRQHFARTDPAVIVAILDAADRLLLGHHVNWEATRVSILAGFVESGESLEQAVHREIAEESGLALDGLRYVGSQPWPFPRSLMLGFVARAASTDVTVDGEEIIWARFFERAELTAAVDAGEITLPLRSSIAHRIIAAWQAGELTV